MLRSLRTPILASLLALAFMACGGGGSSPSGKDGGTGDGPKVQFDGPRYDATGQHDGTVAQQDGGGGTVCNPSGGKPLAGYCKSNGDCACPNGCVNIFGDNTIAGSCWNPCTSNTDCQSTEECVGVTQTEGYCFPKGTLTGTGLNGIQMLDAAPTSALQGTADVTVTAGDINVHFTVGYGRKSSSGAYYFINLFPGTADAPDQTKWFTIACDATKYGVKSFDLSKPTTDGCQLEYDVVAFSGQTLSSMAMQAIVLDGTMTLTAAGTGGAQPVTGTFAGPPTVVKVLQEYCGPNSGPC